MNSSATDFNTYGWTIARDYASKVDDEVTQGLAKWEEVTPGVRTSALVLAQMDCQRQSSVKLNKKDGDAVRICTTYNKCETKGKCDYEVNNSGKTCQRKHECSKCGERFRFRESLKDHSHKHKGRLSNSADLISGGDSPQFSSFTTNDPCKSF